MEKFAILSQSSYTYGKNQDVDETLREIESYGLKNYKIDEELSDNESLVLLNDEQQEMTLSIMGTDPSRIKDIYSDLQIFGGMQFGERFYGESEKLEKMQQKYPKHTAITTGHSLGGHISYNLGLKNNIESHSFNAGASILDSIKNVKTLFSCGDECSKHQLYTTGIDPLSIFNLHGLIDKFGKQNVIYNYKENMDILNHSLDHFLPEKIGKIKSFEEREIEQEILDFCKINPKHRACNIKKHRTKYS